MAWTGTRPTSFVNVVQADLRKKRNQIAAEALQLVVNGSPVDTGAFRGSHRVSVDGPDYGFDAAQTDKPPSQATIEAGLAVIATANQPFQTVIVQTNLPYAEKLEAGNSDQAEHGIYRPAFSHIRAKYARS